MLFGLDFPGFSRVLGGSRPVTLTTGAQACHVSSAARRAPRPEGKGHRADERLEFARVGLRKRAGGTRLRLRWDRSPATCRTVVEAPPLEDQVWHCRGSDYGVYMPLPLEPTFGETRYVEAAQ